MSKKSGRTVAVPSKSKGTPQQSNRSPPAKSAAKSKAPQKPARRNASSSSSSSQHSNGNGSGNGSDDSNESVLDFLGAPPSGEEEEDDDEEVQEEQEVEDDDADELGEEEEEVAENTSKKRTKEASKKSKRKQSQPKKLKDRVTKEIIRLQSGTKLLIPRLPFQRVVREVLQTLNADMRLQSASVECLREASESYLVQLFEDAYLCTFHRTRVTLQVKDVRLTQVLRGTGDPGRR